LKKFGRERERERERERGIIISIIITNSYSCITSFSTFLNVIIFLELNSMSRDIAKKWYIEVRFP